MTLQIDRVHVETTATPALLFEGTFDGEAPTGVQLISARQRLPAILSIAGTRFTARIDLQVASFNGPLKAPRSGRYSLEIMGMDGSALAITLDAALPAQQLLTGFTRVAISAEPAPLAVTFSAPLTDRERGPLQQAALESDYRAARYEPVNAVFFESFFGRNASCNPLAIDRALAELRPDIVRYWSVADASIETPPGAIALIDGSAEWWNARGSVRLLVVNDWLRKRYRRRPHQRVLQTWHGTMLKKLALSRKRLGLRAALATLLERSRWDILLAQNAHSARVFRASYAYRGPIWQEGYPRDDILAGAALADSALAGVALADSALAGVALADSALAGAELAAQGVRARLGIGSDKTIVLYAPTWRDDHPDHVDHLDVSRFAAELGDDYAVLIRGHSRTLLPGEDVRASNVLDVTGYPDVSQLFLVADALVTDYSSVMFDFTVTGKPIYFFTPDLDHYRSHLRGFYFDLLPVAPGPVVTTLDELLLKIRNPAVNHSEFLEKYLAWQLRFNPRDDGGAAHRVVRRLLAEGILN